MIRYSIILIVVSVKMHRISLKIKNRLFGLLLYRFFKGSWKFAIESSQNHDQYVVDHWWKQSPGNTSNQAHFGRFELFHICYRHLELRRASRVLTFSLGRQWAPSRPLRFHHLQWQVNIWRRIWAYLDCAFEADPHHNREQHFQHSNRLERLFQEWFRLIRVLNKLMNRDKHIN